MSVDQTRPAQRVRRAFGDREQAREHAAPHVRATRPDVLARGVACREWILLPQNEECRDDRAQRGSARRARSRRTARARRTRSSDASPPARRDARRRRAAARARPSPRRGAGGGGGGRARGLPSAAPTARGREVRGQNRRHVRHPQRRDGRVPGAHPPDVRHAGRRRRVGRGRRDARRARDDVLTRAHVRGLSPTARCAALWRTDDRIDELQRIMDAADRNPTAVRGVPAWKAVAGLPTEEKSRPQAPEDGVMWILIRPAPADPARRQTRPTSGVGRRHREIDLETESRTAD